MVKLTDTQLDPTALFFVSFDGLVNNASYQQGAILSHAGFQYAAWYTASRSAVVARRRLPAGAWETVALPHQLSTDDSHNSISLGISPTDGRLHIAMDTHDTTVFYIKSEAGLVSDPLNVDHALINQESEAIDSTGAIHVIISYVPGRFTQCVSDFVAQRRSFARAFHLTRSAQGTWTKFEIPVALDAFDGTGLSAFGEVVVDRERVASEGVLSIMYQRSSTGTTPSPIRVIDFQLQ